ncbi:hypothetical protein HDU76_007074 [Blyttiomyces sp. JEL0837]|nr:hypothetical protein HDU76_007074 [Blyttiomyces sp. JEL0837]
MQISSVLAFVAAFAAATVSAAPRGVEQPATNLRGVHWKSDYTGVKNATVARRATNAKLTYYGGPVISNVEVHTIFYGNANYQTQINAFYAGVTNSDFLAWRTIDISSFNLGTQYLYYGIMPDQGGSCAGGCGSSSNTFNNLCSVSSHELVEAITDAAVGVSSGNAAPLAWYDQTNGEIGDICNAQEGTVVGGDGVTYSVQAQWSNSQNACIVSKAGVHPTGTPSIPSTAKTTTTVKTTSAKTTTTAVPTTTPVSSCSHSVCVSGAALSSSCDSCAAAVIAQDSYCGSSSWDSQCISEVATLCPSINCGGTTGGSTCAHSICSTGVKLASDCDPCAQQIIAQDPYCGSVKWNYRCVNEVASICGISC